MMEPNVNDILAVLLPAGAPCTPETRGLAIRVATLLGCLHSGLDMSQAIEVTRGVNRELSATNG